ncbi:unnamed protein product [Schistosoma curassoni]|uniref:C2H2-type domain-containing protein n=1 Tax=Schistosoma curassoni TaxID=6186 RepID=A0A183L095_9TREM|nr:unnamed protein product [Schistosoma curassoni]
MNKYSVNNTLKEKFNQFMNTTDNSVISSKKQSLPFCQNSQSVNPELCQTYKNYDEEHRNILTPSKISNNSGNNSTNDHKSRFMIKDILEFQDHPSSAKDDNDNIGSQSTPKCYSRQYRVDYQRFVQDKKRQNCSTCNLSFCQPVDFVLHIQKVSIHLVESNITIIIIDNNG